MKTRWLFVFLGFVTIGCEDKKDAGKPAASASAPPAASSAPAVVASASAATTASAAPSASAAAGKALSERLKCDKLMPEKSLVAPLAGMKVGQSPAACAECGPTCSLTSGANPMAGASVQFACNEKYDKAAVDKKIDELKKVLKKTKPVTEFGRGGIAGEKEAGLFYEVLVADDDSDCVVTVSWMRGKREDAMAAAKAAIAGVKQSDLQ